MVIGHRIARELITSAGEATTSPNRIEKNGGLNSITSVRNLTQGAKEPLRNHKEIRLDLAFVAVSLRLA
jgi:hypothetical protein